MGLFSQDKTSTTTQSFDERLAASEQGIANRGAQNVGGSGGSQTSSEKGNITGATVADTGAIALSNGSRLNTGLDLSGSQHAEVHQENVDVPVITAFGNTLKDIIGSQIQGSSDASAANTATLTTLLQSQGAQEQALLGDVAGRISALTASAQTGGDSERNKIILYVVGAVLAFLAIVLVFRK
jgi:hypothetical protein